MLSDKQHRFVDEYLIDLNATQAAIRTGYAANSAHVTGSRLLSDAKIADAIAEARAKLAGKLEITQERVLAEMAKIGFSDIRKAVKWHSQANVAFVDSEMDGEIEDGSLRMAVANQVELISSEDIDDDTAGAISEVSMTDKGSLKIKFYDKQSALVNIGKHLGMFTEKHEHTGKDGGPIDIGDQALAKLIVFQLTKASQEA